MSHPKFILVSDPAAPLVGTFVFGLVDQHKDLLRAYEKGRRPENHDPLRQFG